MHYGVLTIIKKTNDVELAVKSALEDYGDGKEWDWYQIGGRWTGALNGYKPETDPHNIETCNLCGGTGTRRDSVALANEFKNGYCNGCSHDVEKYGLPKGQRVKWPTQWVEQEGDVVPLDTVTQETFEQNFYAVCIYDEGWFAKSRYENKPWATEQSDRFKKVEQELPPLEWIKATYPDHLAVVVDCHN